LIEFIYINAKQATLKCNSFYVMTDYNVFIYYDVENNILKEKILTVKNRIKKLHSDRKTLLKQWKSTVMLQVKIYNQKHKLKTFNRNNLVLLSTKNLKQKHSFKKLSHKFTDSFCIANIIKKQIYYLYLFIIYRFHNVFHVFYLESYNWWNNNSVMLILSSSELIDNNEKYKIKKLLKSNNIKVICDIRLNERIIFLSMINEY